MKKCKYKFRNEKNCEEEAHKNSEFCILHIDLPEDEESKEFREINELKKKKVEEKVNTGSWQTATGTTSWSKSVTITPGTNTIYARATDTSENTNETSVIVTYNPPTFDTGFGTYPSISGTHNGTITPNQDIPVTKIYTYSFAGTGGHTESVKIWNSTWNVTATWSGYTGDYHNITFDESFVLRSGETYNYTIRTGSYPQIIHATSMEVTGGTITCTQFTDVNGVTYNNCIPAIRLG